MSKLGQVLQRLIQPNIHAPSTLVHPTDQPPDPRTNTPTPSNNSIDQAPLTTTSTTPIDHPNQPPRPTTAHPFHPTPRSPFCSAAPSPTTYLTAASAAAPWRRSRPPPRPPTRTNSSSGCQTATRPSWGRGARCCRVGVQGGGAGGAHGAPLVRWAVLHGPHGVIGRVAWASGAVGTGRLVQLVCSGGGGMDPWGGHCVLKGRPEPRARPRTPLTPSVALRVPLSRRRSRWSHPC
jgi:hypothetical protein